MTRITEYIKKGNDLKATVKKLELEQIEVYENFRMLVNPNNDVIRQYEKKISILKMKIHNIEKQTEFMG